MPCISGRPLSPAFCPASSCSQRQGRVPVVGPLFIVDHLKSTPRAAVEWDLQVVLGIRLSLGRRCPPGPLALSPSPRPRPRRWCPLVRPVPTTVVPGPRCPVRVPCHCCPHILAPVSSWSSSLLSLSCPGSGCPAVVVLCRCPVVILLLFHVVRHQQIWLVSKKIC